jgi:hypothetical protein
MGKATHIKKYNNLVRQCVTKHTMHYGVDSPEALYAQSRMFRMIRRDFPYNEQVWSMSNAQPTG